jgi:pimeloyl-ACP methyl ester carboxylesterase/DNA-binding CsgD family transcriptional regulator
LQHRPETRYAKSGDVHIAYQVIGAGETDLVFVPGFISNLDLHWEEPGYAHLLRRLSSFARVIQLDKRGTGLSDRVAGLPTLEQRMDDVRAVMDAAGSRRAALLGCSEGGPMAMLFAATYPRRTRALILYGSYAHFHTWVLSPAQLASFVEDADSIWGTGASLKSFAPGMMKDLAFVDWWARFERHGASPQAAVSLVHMNAAIDVRHVLPAIKVPTLVLHRRGDSRVRIGAGRYLAEHIPGARYKDFPGTDHVMWTNDMDPIIDEIGEFLTGARPSTRADRVLATVLAVDIDEPARIASDHGDRTLAEMRARFTALVAAELKRWRGSEIATRRTGALATFDGPARAVRCAAAIRDTAATLGIAVRSGLHTGEIEIGIGETGGFALLTAMSIAQAAARGGILVSRTVSDLVAGAGLRFSERGACAVAGISTPMPLLAYEGETVVPASSVGRAPAKERVASALDVLSPREREILRFIAQGMTNPEIAGTLSLSEHTVKRHVANILMKLDLPTRAAASALAVREELG